MKEIAPSISETAFCCPHCGAYTSQIWHSLSAEELGRDNPVPIFPRLGAYEQIKRDDRIDEKQRTYYLDWYKASMSRLVKEIESISSSYHSNSIIKLHISKCYNCSEYSVWVYDSLVFPRFNISLQPNDDLPSDIKSDFLEAQQIFEHSPRGAAALLRLCVQKICIHLGEKGKNIDADIGELVKKGLSPLIQKSLDIVRVIGNSSVHPGYIDLNDDKETCMTLFKLVNSIAEQMITHPKVVEQLYTSLPIEKREAIERRDVK